VYDLKWIRDNSDAFDAALARRGLEAKSAEILKIDENTSKSQYSRSRRWLQERLLKLKVERKKKDE